MQWLLKVEAEKDPVTLCRLMNIFRRKGLKLESLALASVNESYSIAALVETADSEVDHLFHFLRRTEGIRRVASYRQQAAAEASFVLVDAAGSPVTLPRLLETFPESDVVFASGDRFLLRISDPNQLRSATPALGRARCVPLAPAKTTRSIPPREWEGAPAR